MSHSGATYGKLEQITNLGIKGETSEIHFTLGYPTKSLYPHYYTVKGNTDYTASFKWHVVDILHAVKRKKCANTHTHCFLYRYNDIRADW